MPPRGVRAPSTLGSFLRASTDGHVRQLHSASRQFQFLVRLAAQAPLLPSIDAGHVSSRRLAATAGLGRTEAGRRVRPHQESAATGPAAWPEPPHRHDRHPARSAGDRRDPAARRLRRLGPRRGIAGYRVRRWGGAGGTRLLWREDARCTGSGSSCRPPQQAVSSSGATYVTMEVSRPWSARPACA